MQQQPNGGGQPQQRAAPPNQVPQQQVGQPGQMFVQPPANAMQPGQQPPPGQQIAANPGAPMNGQQVPPGMTQLQLAQQLQAQQVYQNNIRQQQLQMQRFASMGMMQHPNLQQQNKITQSQVVYKQNMTIWLNKTVTETQRQNMHTNQGHRQDEVSFFAHTVTREQKTWLQMWRNHKIMEMQFNEAEAGGSNNVKLQEPSSPVVEDPYLQEMRLMHVDYTEEAYWKRCMAMKIAHECRAKVQQKAKLKRESQAKQSAVLKQQEQPQVQEEVSVIPAVQILEVAPVQVEAEVVPEVVIQPAQTEAVAPTADPENVTPIDNKPSKLAFMDDFAEDEEQDDEFDPDREDYMMDNQEPNYQSNNEITNELNQSIVRDSQKEGIIDTNINAPIDHLEAINPANLIDTPMVYEVMPVVDNDVNSEIYDEDWWQKQTTAEALHGEPEQFNSMDELENRILNMDLTYLKPRDKDTNQEEKKSPEIDMKALRSKDKKEDNEYVNLSRAVLEQKIQHGLKILTQQQAAEAKRKEIKLEKEAMDQSKFDQIYGRIPEPINIIRSSNQPKTTEIDTTKLTDKNIGVHVMKGVKIEQPRHQTMDEWFSGNNMEQEFPNLPDTGMSFIYDLDKEDDGPRVTGIEEEKTQIEALEFARYAPNTHHLRFIEQLCSLQKEIAYDEIQDKKDALDSGELNEHNQRARQKEKEQLERQIENLDAKKIHQNIIEKPNENKDTEPNRKATISFTRQERTFVAWYQSVFGDQWRLITDVINYHPFTRSHLRSKEQIEQLFSNFSESKFRDEFFKARKQYSIPSKPWRTTALPILFQCTQTSSLLNARHFANCRQVAGVRRQRAMRQQQNQTVFKFVLDPKTGELHVPMVQSADYQMKIQPAIQQSSSPTVGLKRSRPASQYEQDQSASPMKQPLEEPILNIDQPAEDWADGDERHVTPIKQEVQNEKSAFDDAVDVIKNEVSTVSDFEDDEEMEDLQSVNDILLKNLLARNVPFNSARPPKRQLLRELLEGRLKRRKLANGIAQQTGFHTMINQVTEATTNAPIRIISQSGHGFESLPSESNMEIDNFKKSKLNSAAKGQDPDKSTPMQFFLDGCAALHKFKRSSSILSECVMMFWFGYFCRKQLQALNFEKLNAVKNQEQEKWQKDKEIDHFFLNQARNIAKVHLKSNENNMHYLPSEQRTINRNNEVKRQLHPQLPGRTIHYQVESTIPVFRMAAPGSRSPNIGVQPNDQINIRPPIDEHNQSMSTSIAGGTFQGPNTGQNQPNIAQPNEINNQQGLNQINTITPPNNIARPGGQPLQFVGNSLYPTQQESLQPNKLDITTVACLWDSRSPYQYNKDRQEQYMSEDIMVLERPRDFLYESQRTHWIDQSCYWFQLNKHLHPRYLRGEWVQTSSYEGPTQQIYQQHAQQQQSTQQYHQYPNQNNNVVQQPHPTQVTGQQPPQVQQLSLANMNQPGNHHISTNNNFQGPTVQQPPSSVSNIIVNANTNVQAPNQNNLQFRQQPSNTRNPGNLHVNTGVPPPAPQPEANAANSTQLSAPRTSTLVLPQGQFVEGNPVRPAQTQVLGEGLTPVSTTQVYVAPQAQRQYVGPPPGQPGDQQQNK